MSIVTPSCRIVCIAFVHCILHLHCIYIIVSSFVLYWIRWEVTGKHEPRRQLEEARPVLGLQDPAVEERVQPLVEVREIQIELGDLDEDAVEGEDGEDPSLLVALVQEIHQQERVGHEGQQDFHFQQDLI